MHCQLSSLELRYFNLLQNYVIPTREAALLEREVNPEVLVA